MNRKRGWHEYELEGLLGFYYSLPPDSSPSNDHNNWYSIIYHIFIDGISNMISFI
jgi:hypothetical protein